MRCFHPPHFLATRVFKVRVEKRGDCLGLLCIAVPMPNQFRLSESLISTIQIFQIIISRKIRCNNWAAFAKVRLFQPFLDLGKPKLPAQRNDVKLTKWVIVTLQDCVGCQIPQYPTLLKNSGI